MNRTLRLVGVPIALSMAVTVLRLTGELAGWSPVWFSPETGGVTPHGWTWLIGITWLPVIFGPYFAVRLWTEGDRPASVARVLAVGLAGALLALAGPRLLVPLLPRGLAWFLLAVWTTMAAGAVLQALAWPGLARTLLAYGLGSRTFVTLVMFAAMLGEWGTHYDYVDMRGQLQMAFWPRFFVLAFFPQLVFWVGFTVILGTLCGGLTVALRPRRRA